MRRLHVLDVCRSLCVGIMVIYHGVYDLIFFGKVQEIALNNPLIELLAAVTAGCFVLLAGVVGRFSRQPLQRGFRLFCWGLAVAVAGKLVGQPIAFGILQLLGLCMMLDSRRAAKPDAPRLWPFLACVLATALSAVLTARVRVEAAFLYPLGLVREDFVSADFFPLLPWGFVYLSGSLLGDLLRAVLTENEPKTPQFSWGKPVVKPAKWEQICAKTREICGKPYPRALTLPGQYSLAIYLIHQPLLYGLCWLAWGQR